MTFLGNRLVWLSWTFEHRSNLQPPQNPPHFSCKPSGSWRMPETSVCKHHNEASTHQLVLLLFTHNTTTDHPPPQRKRTMLDSVIDAARQPFLDLAADIHGSLVYLDAGAAEVAELTLGPAFLLGTRSSPWSTRQPSGPLDVQHTTTLP